jgi:Asp-tRNA(Asn)/Glu-tRNA(Gln) amidotransferase A subunit family amidase
MTTPDPLAGLIELDAPTPPDPPSRRHVLKALAALGVGSAVFQRAVAAQAEQQPTGVTAEMIKQAEWIAGLSLTDDQRKATAGRVNAALRGYETLRKIPLDNGVPPALAFNPAPWLPPPSEPARTVVELTENAAPKKPATADELAFLPVTELAALVRTRQVSSVELTKLYLERLQKYDPILKCVVTLTDKLALQQAEQADREIAAGRYRGPLHGIPWGAKDLIAYPGYKTTWGAGGAYKDQVINAKATVARKLEEAGAVLAAKLTLGALAMGDRWFGGMTRNPWNPRNGSSGSSAGSASATAAGLVGFTLGSETLGSIVSPSTVCGTTGLRPTFGRVSRHGCMALSWSMDKLGPICRSVEDCAVVFGAVHGFDGLDPSAVDRPFAWPCRRPLNTFKVGYFANNTPADQRKELQVLKELGVQLVPIKLPDKYPVGPLQMILSTEAAAVFDEVTRKNLSEGLNSWPQTFRTGQFVPAVEYLRALRVRTLVMREMEQVMAQVDAYAGGGFNDLLLTNLTGHPTVVMPNGFRKAGELDMPTPITFTGRLYGETELLALAHAYQQATGHHLKRPPLEKWKPEEPEKKTEAPEKKP